MAYLMLYGTGWTQRWRVSPDSVDQLRSQILQVGTDGAGRLAVMDPGSETEVTLVVAWAMVAAAVVLDEEPEPAGDGSAGQYA